MLKGFRSFACALLVGLTVLAATPASADVIYSERIEDVGLIGVNLTRTRTLGDGTVLVETNDATIVAENLLSDNWGMLTLDAFSWSHLFIFDPPVGTFLQGTLTLEVTGVQNDFDLVFVETFLVGTLTQGGSGVTSTTLLTTAGLPDPAGVLSTFLADLKLDASVDPTLLDFVTIKSSTVEVSYVPVPEPATLLLVSGGLMAGGWRRYRTRSGRQAAGR